MSITGNARYDWSLQNVSERRFHTWASGASDAELVSLGLRLSDMVAEGLVESISLANEIFAGSDGLVAFVRCGVQYFRFSHCTFSDDGFSALCRWMRNTALVVLLRLDMCEIPDAADAGVGNMLRLGDAIGAGMFNEVFFKAYLRHYDGIAHLMLAVGRSRSIVSLTFDVDVDNAWSGVDYLQQTRQWGHALHWNTTMRHFFCFGNIRNTESVKRTRQAARGNDDVTQIIDSRTPPLGDGYGTDSGDWEALPNELVCVVAERVWPPTAALEMAYVCQRFRDCVLSDYVVRLRHGADADGRWGYGDWRLFYRDVWFEIEQQKQASAPV